MQIADAKSLVGHRVELCWSDRTGREQVHMVEVFEVNFVPLYGPCLLTDTGEIRLDRVVRYQVAA